MFTFIFDRDADYEYSLRNPVLYGAGHKKIYFNFKVFWKYMAMALFHGWICYFFSQLGMVEISDISG
jgi:hypothetical protein